MLASVDPRTGETTDQVEQTTAQQLEETVKAAASANEALGTLGRAGRAEVLNRAADALDADREELVALADRESALGAARLHGELDRTAFQLRAFAEVLRDGAYLEVVVDRAHRTPLGEQPDLRRMLVPVGPVAVFAAGNFPFAFSVAGGDTASALAAGCPVVVKANPGHPLTSQRTHATLCQALAGLAVPAGALGLVHGLDAGRLLVEQPAIRAVGFTGSLAGGRALADLAAARPMPIPFYGELSGVNPFIVSDAAARERADEIGRGLIGSVLLGQGQFCSKPGLIFIPATAAGDELLEAMRAAFAGRRDEPLLTANTRRSYERALERLRGLPGVDAVTSEEPTEPGFRVSAALLLTDTDHFTSDLADECFGPAAVVVRYRDADDLLAIVGALDGTLTATAHLGVDDDPLGRRLVEPLARIAGRLVFDGYPTGVAVSPAMTHGGPWPATNSIHTSVGATAIRRFLRPVTYQNAPPALLPPELRDDAATLMPGSDGESAEPVTNEGAEPCRACPRPNPSPPC